MDGLNFLSVSVPFHVNNSMNDLQERLYVGYILGLEDVSSVESADVSRHNAENNASTFDQCT